MSKKKLSDFSPQRKNANKHTQRGLGLLDDSMSKDGWIGAMTVAADGEAFDGSARLETAFTRFAGSDPIIVETDGTRPVIVKRTDIESAETPRARRLALAANRIAQVDLEWDTDILKEMADSEPDLLNDLWTKNELFPSEKEESSNPCLLQEQYKIIIDCTNEQNQCELLEEFEKRNIPCKALIA